MKLRDLDERFWGLEVSLFIYVRRCVLKIFEDKVKEKLTHYLLVYRCKGEKTKI